MEQSFYKQCIGESWSFLALSRARNKIGISLKEDDPPKKRLIYGNNNISKMKGIVLMSCANFPVPIFVRLNDLRFSSAVRMDEGQLQWGHHLLRCT